jgi:hypothetical protein
MQENSCFQDFPAEMDAPLALLSDGDYYRMNQQEVISRTHDY